jgi:hypothetical protein
MVNLILLGDQPDGQNTFINSYQNLFFDCELDRGLFDVFDRTYNLLTDEFYNDVPLSTTKVHMPSYFMINDDYDIPDVSALLTENLLFNFSLANVRFSDRGYSSYASRSFQSRLPTIFRFKVNIDYPTQKVENQRISIENYARELHSVAIGNNPYLLRGSYSPVKELLKSSDTPYFETINTYTQEHVQFLEVVTVTENIIKIEQKTLLIGTTTYLGRLEVYESGDYSLGLRNYGINLNMVYDSQYYFNPKAITLTAVGNAFRVIAAKIKPNPPDGIKNFTICVDEITIGENTSISIDSNQHQYLAYADFPTYADSVSDPLEWYMITCFSNPNSSPKTWCHLLNNLVAEDQQEDLFNAGTRNNGIDYNNHQTLSDDLVFVTNTLHYDVNLYGDVRDFYSVVNYIESVSFFGKPNIDDTYPSFFDIGFTGLKVFFPAYEYYYFNNPNARKFVLYKWRDRSELSVFSIDGLVNSYNLGDTESCSQLSTDRKYGTTVFFCTRVGGTSNGYLVRTSGAVMSLDPFIINPTAVAAFEGIVVLINQTHNLKLSKDGDQNVDIDFKFTPGKDYTLFFPVATSIVLKTVGNLGESYEPGDYQVFTWLYNHTRLPVHSQQDTKIDLFSKNITSTPKFSHKAFDREDVTLFFFEVEVVGEYTVLITDKDSKPVEATFFSFYSHNNVEWYRFDGGNDTCPGDEEFYYPHTRTDLLVAVPFYTNQSLSDVCTNTSRPITPTSEFLKRLSHFRLEVDVKFDSDILCVGGSSVKVPGRCNTPETLREAQTGCATAEDPYVCTVGDDIFNFATKTERVDTNCVSHGGYCLIHDTYVSSSFAGYSHDQCEDECFFNTSCFFFEHAPQNCTTFEFQSSVPQELRLKECPANTMGFQCRTTGTLEPITSSVIFNPGDTYPFRTEIYHNSALEVTLLHGINGQSRMTHSGSGEKSEFKLDFFPTGNVSGGTVIFGCGYVLFWKIITYFILTHNL